MSWQDEANCLDVNPGLFFPDTRSPQTNIRLEREAKKVCAGCAVQSQCFSYALTSANGRREQFGIFGGVNFEHWQRDRKRRNQQQKRERRKFVA